MLRNQLPKACMLQHLLPISVLLRCPGFPGPCLSLTPAQLPTPAPHTVSVVVLDDPACSGGKAVYLKEPWMSSSASGKWVKWSRNDGHMFGGGQVVQDGAAQAMA